jgi:membrane-associated protein
MDLVATLLDVFLHLDAHLASWAGALGAWLYVLLVLIVFCETGLVVTPFLPGDSLLFAVGALASVEGSPLRLPWVIVLLIAAAVAGDAANYAIGYRAGPRVFSRERSRLLDRRHLERTRRFYDRHGGKTIVLARFIPIIRTFAPFVAGVGRMAYGRFALFNVAGGAAWVLACVLGGYYFGNLPAVKRNFHYVIVAIVVISALPVAAEAVRSSWRGRDIEA